MLDGSILASGYGGYCRGGGAGGGIWITCSAYKLGARAMVKASGGDSGFYSSTGGGGGGRIAIGVNLTSAGLDRLYSTGRLPGSTVQDLADLEEWSGKFSVAGGTGYYGGTFTNSAAGTAVVVVAPPMPMTLILR